MTFWTWLKHQKKRGDPVGDLAGDVLTDSCFPKHARTFERVRDHLIAHHACDGALDAAEEAWAEYALGVIERAKT